MKLLLLLSTLVGLSRCVMVEWTSDDFPNPQTNPLECGRHPGRPSYVCDPNKIISTRAADFLDHILVNLPNDTACPCSAKSCEEREHSKGYIMVIALVRKLERPDRVPDTPDGRKGLARQFVFNLLKKKWSSWGTCDEVTVVLFSKEDHILMTLSGTTPRRKLTEGVTMEIQTKLSRFFRDDGNIGQGLHYLTLNYRRVIDGHHYLPVMYADVPVDSAAALIKISVITSLLTTILLRIFC